jgi:hypothetical protein
VVSKIVAEEMVTTSAGTFSAFKIESLRHEISASDASKSWEYQEVVWYAPQINHWVRRTFMARTQKRLTASTSEELIEFARKP